MLKSTKRFIIHTEAVNDQGFRMLTAGCDLSAFNQNPLLLFNHTRPDKEGGVNQILPLGYWADIKLEGESITAVPVFDDTDDFARKIYNKVENGTLKMCSAGAEPIQTSTDNVVVGQTRATVTKWRLKEASIVDSGSNPDSLAVALYDENSNRIQLSAGSNNYIPKINLSAMDKEEKLTEEQKEAKMAAEKKLKEEAQLAANDELEGLKKENEELKAQVKKLMGDDEDKKGKELAAQALSDKKITAKQVPHFIKLAAADYASTAELIASLPANVSLSAAFTMDANEAAAQQARVIELSAKPGKDLFTSGGFDELRKLDTAAYKRKYLAHFGKEPIV
jgi:hypothetical protein